MSVVEADLTWTGSKFESGVRVAIEGERISALGTSEEPTHRITHRALLPGFCNAHSHSFQRGLRGLGETFPAGAGSFWSWREAMYALVERLDRQTFYDLNVRAYREMLAAGITAVAEFHYLHHDQEGDFAFDRLILDAAQEAGIRITLLLAFYKSGGIGKPLASAQRRFGTPSIKDYWSAFDSLAAHLHPSQQLGVVAHSIRAATPDEVAELYREAIRRDLVMHMHVEEQRRELEECEAAYGKRPMQLLLDRLPSMDRLTAVHCTHTAEEDLLEFFRRGGRACITPLTEGNLGDGIPVTKPLQANVAQLSLGSDSNARISMMEEMRWLEYAHRLKGECRGVFTNAAGRLAPNLLRVATAGGAASLGIKAGAIAPGMLADFVSIRLDHPSLAGITPENLAEAVILGCGDEVIDAVAVGGVWHQLR